MPKRPRSESSSDDNSDSKEGSKAAPWQRPGQKTGAYSAAESARVMAAFREAVARHQTTLEEVFNGDARSKKSSARGLWKDMAELFPERAVRSLYQHVTRCEERAMGFQKGGWKEEELRQLQLLHDRMGPKWVAISKELRRSSTDCRVKYHSVFSKKVVARTTPAAKSANTGKAKIPARFTRGVWSADEEALLLSIVRKATGRGAAADPLSIPESEIPWQTVADEFGTRSRIQVTEKWKGIVKKGAQEAEKRSAEAVELGVASAKLADRRLDLELVEKLLAAGCDDEAEVYWAQTGVPKAQRRWQRLRNATAPSLSFKEALDAAAKCARAAVAHDSDEASGGDGSNISVGGGGGGGGASSVDGGGGGAVVSSGSGGDSAKTAKKRKLAHATGCPETAQRKAIRRLIKSELKDASGRTMKVKALRRAVLTKLLAAGVYHTSGTATGVGLQKKELKRLFHSELETAERDKKVAVTGKSVTYVSKHSGASSFGFPSFSSM